MSKDEVVSTEVLLKVCKVLHCDVGDIVEFIDDEIGEIERKYKMIINQNTMSYDMISRVLCDHRKSTKTQRQFVADHWSDYLDVANTIEAFDSGIKKISVDAIATQRIIDQLKRERQKLQERIRSITKQDNGVVLELHNCISAYAKELDISETYVSPNRDYIIEFKDRLFSPTDLMKAGEQICLERWKTWKR